MNVLVTGGAGFIGSHITEEFIRDGHNVTVFDSLRSGYKKNIEDISGVKFILGDVRDMDTLLTVTRDMELIVHLAALISVPESMEAPLETVDINTKGTLNVLQASVRNNVRKVILASSAANYGDNPVVPKKEDMIPEPKSPYAVTKLDGEYYLDIFRQYHGLETTSLRFFNVFGPRQDQASAYAAAIPIFTFKALKNEDLIIFGDGEQTRDFIYVKNIVDAIRLVSDKGTGVFNVACGGRITINDLANKIVHIIGSSSKIVYREPRPGDVKHSTADISKIKSLGFFPKINLEEGLKKTIDYMSGDRI